MKPSAVLGLFLLLCTQVHAADCKNPPAGAGSYEKSQAMVGQQLFSDHCASCHGADLAGQSGPALAGKDFVSYLQFTKISAPQLLAFMESQMPYQAPGSLKKSDYVDLFSYILSVNGYPAGSTALNHENVACVAMLPHPGAKP